MTSIPGVGSATATEVILATDEFKAITDRAADRPKKLAASAVRSGTGPRTVLERTADAGKTRVSQHARKRLKSLFHLAVMSEIRSKAGRPVP